MNKPTQATGYASQHILRRTQAPK